MAILIPNLKGRVMERETEWEEIAFFTNCSSNILLLGKRKREREQWEYIAKAPLSVGRDPLKKVS